MTMTIHPPKSKLKKLGCVWIKMKNENYFTIQFIFVTIY